MIPNVKGFFDGKDLPVEVKVTSPSGEEVQIEENKIRVSELGDYSLAYKTSISEYKTNLGNDSYALETITLKSNAQESDLVKVNDINHVLPEGTIVQCQRIHSGSTYEKISSLLENISDHYEVTDISLMDQNGDKLNLSGTIQCLINTNPNYDRNKVKVAFVLDDKLEPVSSESYGRYIRFESQKTGTYVIYVEGVKSSVNLPLLITLSFVGGVLVLALILFLILFRLRKKKKRQIA